nr:hypothetical protein [Tanacetum cinerariifolium]
MVGISSLDHRFNKIQLMILSRCLSDILKKITDKLNSSVLELDDLSPNLKSIPDGVIGFLEMAGSFKESLQKILIKKMHGNARLVEMLNKLYEELHTSISFSNTFLVEEITILDQVDAIRLPYFFPHSAFLCLLERKVNIISEFPVNFANKACAYLDTVCVKVLADHFGNYPGLLPSMRKATRSECARDEFLKVMCNHNVTTIDAEDYGRIEVRHLLNVSENMRNQAFDLKMRITAYMNIVMKRMKSTPDEPSDMVREKILQESKKVIRKAINGAEHVIAQTRRCTRADLTDIREIRTEVDEEHIHVDSRFAKEIRTEIDEAQIQMSKPAKTMNNLTIRSILEKEKHVGLNFLDWYRNQRIVLGAEHKLVHMEMPTPDALALVVYVKSFDIEVVEMTSLEVYDGITTPRSRLRMEKHSLAVYEENELFRTHPYLSLIDKSIVGIPHLVDKLSHIQSALLANCLPRICRSTSLAPPIAHLAAFFRVLSPFIQNTSSSFLEFKHDDPSIGHPKGLLKLLNQSRDWCDKAETHIKLQFLFAFDNQYDDHLTAISKAAAYAVKLLKKKHTRSLIKFLEGEKVASYKSDPRIEESINHLMVIGLNEFKRCVVDHSQILQLKNYDGYIDVSSLHAISTDIASSGPLDIMEKFSCPFGYNKGIEEEELERELDMYDATRSIASRATKWIPNGH